MGNLISDLDLRILTDKYCISDGSETPVLIELLWDIRNFQTILKKLPHDRVQFMLHRSQEIDDAIALQILNLPSIKLTQKQMKPGFIDLAIAGYMIISSNNIMKLLSVQEAWAGNIIVSIASTCLIIGYYEASRLQQFWKQK